MRVAFSSNQKQGKAQAPLPIRALCRGSRTRGPYRRRLEGPARSLPFPLRYDDVRESSLVEEKPSEACTAVQPRDSRDEPIWPVHEREASTKPAGVPSQA